MPAAQPFVIRASDDQLEDLDRRLAGVRWPESADAGWALGTDPRWLSDLVDFWRRGLDWRAQEEWLEATLPGQRVQVDGLDLHFSHLPGRGPAPMPLLLLHGWPSSHVEMHKIAGPLADPAAHGGSPEDAFDVVVGSVPGHGFSTAPADPGFGADACSPGSLREPTDVRQEASHRLPTCVRQTDVRREASHRLPTCVRHADVRQEASHRLPTCVRQTDVRREASHRLPTCVRQADLCPEASHRLPTCVRQAPGCAATTRPSASQR